MVDLSITYMGLRLKNPVIVASCGLTHSVGHVQKLEKYGASAVVLKSLFEEQILHRIHANLKEDDNPGAYPEVMDYIRSYTKENSIDQYIDLIGDCKRRVEIPVIASINCVSSGEWPSFANRIEQAGADALELNIFLMPMETRLNGREIEQAYFDIIEAVKKEIRIPIAVKLSYYFSDLGGMVRDLSRTGVRALVLFNRFFSHDIDIENLRVTSTNVLSQSAELYQSLRWIAILSPFIECDLAASTGIHNGEAVIKQILAGADVVEISSTLYHNGIEYITQMLDDIRTWMERKGFSRIDDFRGKLSIKETENPAVYSRIQFIRNFHHPDLMR